MEDVLSAPISNGNVPSRRQSHQVPRLPLLRFCKHLAREEGPIPVRRCNGPWAWQPLCGEMKKSVSESVGAWHTYQWPVWALFAPFASTCSPPPPVSARGVEGDVTAKISTFKPVLELLGFHARATPEARQTGQGRGCAKRLVPVDEMNITKKLGRPKRGPDSPIRVIHDPLTLASLVDMVPPGSVERAEATKMEETRREASVNQRMMMMILPV
ncbi:hypothetical protein N7539_002961 [Penicillium diatomitis]|uniref:Uncharacterized protein n=1 Tax=Penicillium diatomitis TaxID=2819901 RepID=A0A9W9XFQ0_9EURO|nr:uncharacterized protein N7539_002961 [Penicillium diatomitis]KAJ5491394.1 hypothetical protein N7539_002961 [Penicillium diatomitis]